MSSLLKSDDGSTSVLYKLQGIQFLHGRDKKFLLCPDFSYVTTSIMITRHVLILNNNSCNYDLRNTSIAGLIHAYTILKYWITLESQILPEGGTLDSHYDFLVWHPIKLRHQWTRPPASARMGCALNPELCSKHKATLTGQKEREWRRVSFQSLRAAIYRSPSSIL